MTEPVQAQERPQSGLAAVAVAVDVVLLTVRAGQLCVLLVPLSDPPFEGGWALPGGRVRARESLEEAAAARVVQATWLTGTDLPALHQLRTYGAPTRDPRDRVVSTAYLALAPALPVTPPGDPCGARFWPVGDLDGEEGPNLAFDHSSILTDGLDRAANLLEYTPLATSFVEEPFSLAELRRVYEAVWGVRLDAANFRRKVLSAPGFVEQAADRAAPGPGGGRPAQLYRRGGAGLLHPAMLRPGRQTA